MARVKHQEKGRVRAKTAGKAPKKQAETPADFRSSSPESVSESEPAIKPKKKRRRRRSGMRAISEIRRYQKSGELLIPNTNFMRLTRQIAGLVLDQQSSFLCGSLRMSPSALRALQSAAEAHLVTMFEDSQRLAIHAKRVTITENDIRRSRETRGEPLAVPLESESHMIRTFDKQFDPNEFLSLKKKK